MSWLQLPQTGSDSLPAFADMQSCQKWLAAQPLANAPSMQENFSDQIDRLNRWKMDARERFKVLETLRKPLFMIENESARRYEYRPLPLAPVEQRALDATCRNWRGLAVGYLHCLHAIFDGNAALAPHAAKIAHRALTSLRLEQLARNHAASVLPGEWWRWLHCAYRAAEQLAVAEVAVADRLFAETRESTPAGQYVMALLLYLARPHELSRSQQAAVQRWFARWREKVRLQSMPDERAFAIDLESERPPQASDSAAVRARWLNVTPVLAKLKTRARSLREGQSPEDLKLGSGLPADACLALMQFLHGALHSPPVAPDPDASLRELHVASTLDAIYRLLGGPTLEAEAETTVQSARRIHEQIAIFGHSTSAEGAREAGTPLENWLLLGEQHGDLLLLRAADAEGERLANRSVVALADFVVAGTPALAIVRSLCVLENGALYATARLQPGTPLALRANGRERMTNRLDNYPSILLPATASEGKGASLFIPPAVMGRLTRFNVADLPGEMKIGDICERGANYERVRCE